MKKTKLNENEIDRIQIWFDHCNKNIPMNVCAWSANTKTTDCSQCEAVMRKFHKKR